LGWRGQCLALRLAVKIDATIRSVENPVRTGTGNERNQDIAAGVIATQIIVDAAKKANIVASISRGVIGLDVLFTSA
jgi:hypothetical protein